jgi:hypothetical protein
MEQPELRDRSNLPNSSRKLELVAPEEIALAVAQTVARSLGIDRHEVPGPVARLLGFAKVTANMRSRIDSQIGQMVEDGRLRQQGEHLVTAEQ